MNYDYCRIFYYVGKHQNITKASRELYTSQPAVTRVIKKLEDDLGCTLLIRNKSGVDFTPEGQTLFNYVSTIQDLLQKCETEISGSVSTDSGTVYIAATVTALEECLFACLQEFHTVFPKMKFKLVTGSSDNSILQLVNGAVDLAFISTPYDCPPTLNHQFLLEFDNILIAGNRFIELKNRKCQLSELESYPFVSLNTEMKLRAYSDDIFLKSGIQPAHEIECDSASLIVPMVSNNLGIGIVPETFAKKAIAEKKVFRVSLNELLPKRELHLITNPNHPQSKAAREFKKSILEYCQKRQAKF